MSDINKTKTYPIKTFFNKRLVKILSISLSVALVMGSIAGASYGIYYAISSSNQQEDVTPFNWKDFSPEWKDFSTANSFRVQLASARQNDTVTISSGTAWSWYQQEIPNQNFHWYLMTNFHVVNDALYYNANNSHNFIHEKKIIVSKGFALQTYNHNLTQYDDIATKNKDWRSDDIRLSNRAIANYSPSKVEVIFDYTSRYDDSDNLNLFSNSSPTMDENSYYNLDAALIKISYTWSDYLKFKTYFKQIGDPYAKYLLQSTPPLPTKENTETYLAGNPSKAQQIVASKFDANYYIFYDKLDVNSSQYPEILLKELKAPYYYSKIGYNGWYMGPGASGSAIYQGHKIAENTQPIDLFPIGIYWGVSFNSSNSTSFPSFIPFIFESSNTPDNTHSSTLSYNIFENFKIFLATGYANY